MALGILPTSKRTAVVSFGTFQLNFALLSAYHLLGSGWVSELITGASGVPAISAGVTVSGAPDCIVPIEKLASPIPVKIFVPLPSLASAEPEEKIRDALPAALVLKVIVMALPLEPVKPGFKTMPSKFTVPAELENDGSCTQRVKIEPVLEREVISNLSAGNEITPDAAFSA